MDASHFDANTAYAAVNTIRLDDLRPHIYRTHDDGKTWQEIVRGIPADENVNVVREDPQRRGLLFAGTERGVYVSFNDGENWQSLRLNLPATSVRDLIVKDDDLCIATHGRGFWILDNITPLRQLPPNEHQAASCSSSHRPALRVRWNSNTDTPLPPDEPAGENPPRRRDDRLFARQRRDRTGHARDQGWAGKLVRRYASTDPAPPADPKLKIPRYWVKPPRRLSDEPGLHRFFWDMHGAPLPDAEPEYPMTAVRTRNRAAADRALDYAGRLFRRPDDGRPDFYSAAQGENGSADQGDECRSDETISSFRKRFTICAAEAEPIGKSYEALVAELEKAKERRRQKSVQKQIEALHEKLAEFADPAAVRAGRPAGVGCAGQSRKTLRRSAASGRRADSAAGGRRRATARATRHRWKNGGRRFRRRSRL